MSGGEAATVTRHKPVRIEGEAEVPFGVEEYNLVPEEIGGGIDNRAGSHPYQLTTTVALNQTADPKTPPALARNFAFKLPPGQIGSATAVPKCSTVRSKKPPGQAGANLCPEDTAIGVAIITFDEPVPTWGEDDTDTVVQPGNGVWGASAFWFRDPRHPGDS